MVVFPRPLLTIDLQSIIDSEQQKDLPHNSTSKMRSNYPVTPSTVTPTSVGSTPVARRVLPLPNFHEAVPVPSTPIPLVSKEAVTCASSLLSIDPAASILSPEILRKMKLALVRGAATIPLHGKNTNGKKKRKESTVEATVTATVTVTVTAHTEHAFHHEYKETSPIATPNNDPHELFSPRPVAIMPTSPNPALSRDSSRGSIPELQHVHSASSSSSSSSTSSVHEHTHRKRCLSPASCASIEEVGSTPAAAATPSARRVRRKVLPLIPSLSALNVTSHGGDAHADEVLAAYCFARYLVDWAEQFTIIDKEQVQASEQHSVVEAAQESDVELHHTHSTAAAVYTESVSLTHTLSMADATPNAMYFATTPHPNQSIQSHVQRQEHQQVYPACRVHSPQHHFESAEIARDALIAASSDVTHSNPHECEHIAASLISSHQYIPQEEQEHKSHHVHPAHNLPFSPMCFHLSTLASPCGLAAATAPAMSPPPFDLEDATGNSASAFQQPHYTSVEHNGFNIALHAFGKSR